MAQPTPQGLDDWKSRMTTDAGDQVIRIAAAVLGRADGKTLLVRKHGTSAFMQAGGKIEQHEDPVTALCRELAEELGLCIDTTDAVYLGRFEAPAANEPGHRVIADLFGITVADSIEPTAEIAEIVWIDPADPGDLSLAPLTRDHVLSLCGTSI
jgi:8-oxo-dGTP diphosphatase